MQPEDSRTPSQADRGQITPPMRDAMLQQNAVAQMTRDQIQQIYSTQSDEAPTQEPITAAATFGSASQANAQQPPKAISSEEWSRYHTAWQNYYQKYYEKYYVGAVSSANQKLQEHAEQLQKMQTTASLPARPSFGSEENDPEEVSQEDALAELHNEILDRVKQSASSVRRSRHFIPLVSALTVMLVFAFLQYNQIIFSYTQAYVSPGNIDSENIIIDPNASVKVSKKPRLIIPKFNIDVPVIYDNTIGSTAQETHDLQMAAMNKGVAYFGAKGFSAHPGEKGNFGIAGHSSNNFYDSGAAKFVFAPILRMGKGDIFYINYEGTRYTYSVSKIKEVQPDGVDALKVGTKKPMATLITCTPLGTANRRLLVFGEQINPNPDMVKKTQKNPTNANESATDITGKTPSLLESIFGSGQ